MTKNFSRFNNRQNICCKNLWCFTASQQLYYFSEGNKAFTSSRWRQQHKYQQLIKKQSTCLFFMFRPFSFKCYPFSSGYFLRQCFSFLHEVVAQGSCLKLVQHQRKTVRVKACCWLKIDLIQKWYIKISTTQNWVLFHPVSEPWKPESKHGFKLLW